MPAKLPPSEITIEGDVARVELRGGGQALIDAADVPLVEGWTWRRQPNYATAYAVAIESLKPRKLLHMHRLIADVGDADQVDHIDRDGLNNRRGNLRGCDNAQNQWNRAKLAPAHSRFKGVSPWERRWRATIHYRGETITIGYYATEVEAARAYDERALNAFGRFARTNEMMGLFTVVPSIADLRRTAHFVPRMRNRG